MRTQKLIDISTRTLMLIGIILMTLGYLTITDNLLLNKLFVKIGLSSIVLSSIVTILDYFFPKK